MDPNANVECRPEGDPGKASSNQHSPYYEFNAQQGSQSNNTGPGNQFIGATFNGPVDFRQNGHVPMLPREINVLRGLCVSRYRDQKDRNPERIPGTCEWFVTHPIFQSWRGSQSSRMLWVSADPGCGKSVLVKYLADSILQGGESRTVGYFFFKADFEEQKSITTALCCILHQLFTQNRALLTESAIERFETNEHITTSFSELWDILLHLAKQTNAGEIICLFDAFDECEQAGSAQLTEALLRLYTDETRHNFNLKILISSRPYHPIRHGFQPLKVPEQPAIHLSGENDTEMKNISREIRHFVEKRVQDLKYQLRLTEEEGRLLLDKLTCVGNRTYLWVHLTLDLISESAIEGRKQMLEIVSNLPSTVNDVYERILSRSRDSQKARRLLHIVIGAARPLTLREMNFALTLNEHQRSYGEVECDTVLHTLDTRFREHIRDLCGLFITIVEGKVYLLHQTAREFLTGETPDNISASVQNHLEWGSSFELQESECIIAKICMQQLLFTDFQMPSGSSVPDLTNCYGFLDYSAKYWVTHFLASTITMKSTMETLLTLCDANEARCQIWFQVYWTSIGTNYPTGFTSLMIASYFGLAPVVKHLIRAGEVEFETEDDTYGRTSLSWAAGNGHHAIVKLLTTRSWRKSLRRRARIDSRDKRDRTPLLWASLNGHDRVVSVLLEAGAVVHSKDDIGGTAIAYATLTGHSDAVKLLVKHNNQVQLEGVSMGYLLIPAARKGSKEVVELLLDHNMDVETKDFHRSTSLSLAAENGHEAVAKLLLDHGADIDSKNVYHQTPLCQAIKNGREAVVKLLLDRGADIHFKDIDDRTHLSWAAGNGYKSLVKLLLHHGADIDSTDINGQTPLSWAIRNSHEAVINLLLDHGADIDFKDINSRTPLSWAAGNSYISLVKPLLHHGADIDSKDINGRTPLSWAAGNGYKSLVKLLLDHGAQIESTDSKGWTPLSWATENHHRTVVRVLLDPGADGRRPGISLWGPRADVPPKRPADLPKRWKPRHITEVI